MASQDHATRVSTTPKRSVVLDLKGNSVDRLTVLAMFSWQYLLMAFFACLGIVQLAAARSGRRHLWLLGNRRWTALAGVVLLIAGVVLFYLMPLFVTGPWGPPDPIDGTATRARASLDTLPEARNLNDTDGGLSGHWQALWFAIAWISAVFFARAVGRWRPPLQAQETADSQDERVLIGVTSGDRR